MFVLTVLYIQQEKRITHLGGKKRTHTYVNNKRVTQEECIHSYHMYNRETQGEQSQILHRDPKGEHTYISVCTYNRKTQRKQRHICKNS
jgi:hypothetical protein